MQRPSTRRRSASALTRLGLCAALVASSCAGAGRARLLPPEVSLVDLRVAEVTPFETSLALTLRCSNENPEALTTTGAVYAVTLNGVRAGRALADRTLELPRLGEAVETVLLRVDNLLLLTRLRGLLSARSLEYELQSRLYVASEGRERELRSEHGGWIELPESWSGGLEPLRALPAYGRYAAPGE